MNQESMEFIIYIIFMNIFLSFQGQTCIVREQQLKHLLANNEMSCQRIIFTSNGKVCSKYTIFDNDQTVYAHLPLLGGKGGFGAKLKTEGGKKVRPNDNMYSRDLQGRPVAYATMTKQYQEYFKKKIQDDEKVQKQLADFQVVSNTYREDYASTRLDSTYNARIQQHQKRLKDAMKVGMKKYLEKKKQQVQNQGKEEQKSEKENGEKGDKNEDEVDIDLDGLQYEQQEQELKAVKRPLQNKQSEQLKQQPPKKVIKPNQQSDIAKVLPQTKPQAPKLQSAREKLKSLFKK